MTKTPRKEVVLIVITQLEIPVSVNKAYKLHFWNILVVVELLNQIINFA